MFPLPPRSTLFPYTTLFRSIDTSGILFIGGGAFEGLSRRINERKFERRSGFRSSNFRSLMRRLKPSNRSEEHTSELQSRFDLVCRLLLEKKKNKNIISRPKN